MKNKIVISIICIVVVLGGYYFLFGNFKAKIRAIDVKSITISNVIKYENGKDNSEIEEIVSMYNRALIINTDNGTTPSHGIVIELKNGKKVKIDGTTQGFHYVKRGIRTFIISSHELSEYLRNLDLTKK